MGPIIEAAKEKQPTLALNDIIKNNEDLDVFI